VIVGYDILKALRLRSRGVEIISCPTCGRCEVDLLPVVEAVEKGVRDISAPLTVALMGCVVNGPGEAREADLGIAGGKGVGVLSERERSSEDPGNGFLPRFCSERSKRWPRGS